MINVCTNKRKFCKYLLVFFFFFPLSYKESPQRILIKEKTGPFFTPVPRYPLTTIVFTPVSKERCEGFDTSPRPALVRGPIVVDVT